MHLGQDDEPVAAVRERVGAELLIGLSTHSPEQLAAGLETDADYVCVGPVYATPTKPDYPAVGLDLVRHAAETVTRPWFAIGGIDGTNVAEVAAAGARRVSRSCARSATRPTHASPRPGCARPSRRRRRVSSRQKRKQRQRRDEMGPVAAASPSRSEQKDAEARAALVPLEPGERPLRGDGRARSSPRRSASSNLGLYVAGYEIDGERPQIVGVLAFSALMLAAAWGMWKVRYWAVLGMQALLGLLIVILFSLFAMTAATSGECSCSLAIIIPAGTLFWFMVKAMARIQMPTRDQ